MQLSEDWRRKIDAGAYDRQFGLLYPHDMAAQKRRYADALVRFERIFGEGRGVCLFSAPGRTELCGNHTDHQRGRVLAAAVTMDAIAVVAKRADSIVTIDSQGHGRDSVDVLDLAYKQDEVNTSGALVRGIAAGFARNGYGAGGFDAYVTSDVLKGAGLSSSAAYEVLLGTILSHLFNNGVVGAVQVAQIGQYAENAYFGKPCGLMDQTASSVGGVVAIDFQVPGSPRVEKIGFEFSAAGHTLFIVDAGGSHADLSGEYAAIPAEMNSVAAYFGADALRSVDSRLFYDSMGELRGKVPDRALLRAIHFFDEDARVQEQTDALKNADLGRFKALMIGSGYSSAMYLQNCYPIGDISERSVALALAVSERALDGKGAWRVHGGGFAGTVLALVPNGLARQYRQTMESVFGGGCCHALYVRPVGGYAFLREKEAENG